MAGLRGQNAPVLIIGVHKAELPFGREVAKIVLRSKVIPNLKVIEIEEGLGQPHTFRDRKFFYDAFHKEIYLQIYQQSKNRHDLILDLHAGHLPYHHTQAAMAIRQPNIRWHRDLHGTAGKIQRCRYPVCCRGDQTNSVFQGCS